MKLKWIATIFVLLGIFLTNLNFYPINIYMHAFGVILWTLSGYLEKDKAVITNFGLQIPIFCYGIFISILG
jgi:hypothetical protein